MCARRSPEAGAHGPERDAAHARAADDGPLVNGREKVPPLYTTLTRARFQLLLLQVNLVPSLSLPRQMSTHSPPTGQWKKELLRLPRSSPSASVQSGFFSTARALDSCRCAQATFNGQMADPQITESFDPKKHNWSAQLRGASQRCSESPLVSGFSCW